MSFEELLQQQKRSNAFLETIVELQKDLLEVSRKHQSRDDLLGEMMVSRLNWLEWRSALLFESQWSNTSVQGAYKLWKLNGMKQPSREGTDREGYRGSPWFSSDEQKADESLPDEVIFEGMEELPEIVKKETPFAIEMARAYRTSMLAQRAARMEQAKAKEARKAFLESKKRRDEQLEASKSKEVTSGSGLSPAEREQVETLEERRHEEAEQNEGHIEEQPLEEQP